MKACYPEKNSFSAKEPARYLSTICSLDFLD
jgi:hypothetical protein